MRKTLMLSISHFTVDTLWAPCLFTESTALNVHVHVAMLNICMEIHLKLLTVKPLLNGPLLSNNPLLSGQLSNPQNLLPIQCTYCKIFIGRGHHLDFPIG